MTFAELIDSQWSNYADKHRNRTNLLIHIVAVPVVWIGAIDALGGVLLLLMGVPGAFNMLFWGAVLMGLSLFAQNRGDALETSRPAPFRDGKDFALRAVAEQFITFPRFVLSGGWLENLRRAAP